MQIQPSGHPNELDYAVSSLVFEHAHLINPGLTGRSGLNMVPIRLVSIFQSESSVATSRMLERIVGGRSDTKVSRQNHPGCSFSKSCLQRPSSRDLRE